MSKHDLGDVQAELAPHPGRIGVSDLVRLEDGDTGLEAAALDGLLEAVLVVALSRLPPGRLLPLPGPRRWCVRRLPAVPTPLEHPLRRLYRREQDGVGVGLEPRPQDLL